MKKDVKIIKFEPKQKEVLSDDEIIKVFIHKFHPLLVFLIVSQILDKSSLNIVFYKQNFIGMPPHPLVNSCLWLFSFNNSRGGQLAMRLCDKHKASNVSYLAL